MKIPPERNNVWRGMAWVPKPHEQQQDDKPADNDPQALAKLFAVHAMRTKDPLVSLLEMRTRFDQGFEDWRGVLSFNHGTHFSAAFDEFVRT